MSHLLTITAHAALIPLKQTVNIFLNSKEVQVYPPPQKVYVFLAVHTLEGAGYSMLPPEVGRFRDGDVGPEICVYMDIYM